MRYRRSLVIFKVFNKLKKRNGSDQISGRVRGDRPRIYKFCRTDFKPFMGKITVPLIAIDLRALSKFNFIAIGEN
jgi:hypothetical protein